MPFTLSHPAAAVPFVRLGLPLSALVIGSMTPDFPYFVQWSAHFQFGHTLRGLFEFCVPAGLAALVVFHALLKQPLLALMPPGHLERLAGPAAAFRFGTARQFAMIVLAVLIGAATHLAWDSLTHSNSPLVENSPAMRVNVLPGLWGGLPLYRLFQHGSTIVGACLLAWWYTRWYKTAPVGGAEAAIKFAPRQRAYLLASMAAAACVGGITYSKLTTQREAHASYIHQFALHSVTASGGLFMAVLLAYSIVWQIAARR